MNPSKQKIINYIKVIEGQVHGLQVLLIKDTYCIDVIMQTSAIKQGLSNIEDILMKNHLSTCAIEEIKNGNGDTAINEILKVYKLKKK